MTRLIFVLFCFVFYVLVTRFSYDSNVKKKAEIHVAYFHERGIITEPRIFMKHTVVLGFITGKNSNTHD